MRLLLLALGSMFFQQTYISLGKVLPAVLAPVVLMDLDIAPSWFGIYMALAAGSVVVVQVGCGSFIVRYGALRVSQVSLVLGGGSDWHLCRPGLFQYWFCRLWLSAGWHFRLSQVRISSGVTRRENGRRLSSRLNRHLCQQGY
jgi:hypothetical protein